MRRASPAWVVVIVAFAIPMLFAWFTNHAWEDYYITLRSSRNLAEGHGLVFNQGDRLHTFTSPLGVLIPALIAWITGPGREQIGLWIFRVFNAGVLAAAGILLWRRADTLNLGRVGRFVLFGMLFADAKLIDFSINGQETAIMAFFVVLLWSELEAPGGPRAICLAAAFSGLMWTRPDAFILGGVITLAYVLLRPHGEKLHAVRWPVLLRGIMLGGILYAPWFFWAWWYYGSPIPNTIVAKAAATIDVDPVNLFLLPFSLLGSGSQVDDVFLPAYWSFGGWPSALGNLGHALIVCAVFVWMFPRIPLAGRRASLALFIGALYLYWIRLYPWYVPPWTVLACLALAFAADWAWNQAEKAVSRFARPLVFAACAFPVAFQILILACVARQLRVQQRVIEDEGRRAIGEWLHQNAAPSDTVFLEPLGYIGYFSGLKTYDYPGLSSREVVSAIREGATTFPMLIGRLKPDWVILRPPEIRQQHITELDMRGYKKVKTIDNGSQLDAVSFLPGRGWLDFDSCFLVLKRTRSESAAR
jgi:hypothetical protein